MSYTLQELESRIKNKILISRNPNKQIYYSIIDMIVGDFKNNSFYIRCHYSKYNYINSWDQLSDHYYSCPLSFENLVQLVDSFYFKKQFENRFEDRTYHYYIL